jgi:hypothetical protein
MTKPKPPADLKKLLQAATTIMPVAEPPKKP